MIQNEVVRRIPSAEFWGTHLARRHAVAHYVPERRGTAGFLAPFDPNPHGAYVGYRTQRLPNDSDFADSCRSAASPKCESAILAVAGQVEGRCVAGPECAPEPSARRPAGD